MVSLPIIATIFLAVIFLVSVLLSCAEEDSQLEALNEGEKVSMGAIKRAVVFSLFYIVVVWMCYSYPQETHSLVLAIIASSIQAIGLIKNLATGKFFDKHTWSALFMIGTIFTSIWVTWVFA